MKSILFLNFKYFQYKKAKMLKQIVVFAICTILLVIQSLSVYNLFLGLREQQLIANGKYDAVLIGYNENNSINFDETGTISIFASIINQNAKYNNHLYVGYANKKAENLTYLQLSEGAFPEKENEILIEKSVSSVYRKNINVGDKIILKLDFIDESQSEDKEFVVSGIIENYSKTQWKSNDKSLFPQILVSESYFSSLRCSNQQMLLVSFTNNYEKELVKNELILNGVCDNFFINSINNLDIELKSISTVSTIGLTIFTGIFSIILIISNMLLSKNERLNNIGLYRIVGIGSSDILKIFQLREAIPLFSGIIIGDILGVLLFSFFNPSNLTSVKYNIGIIAISNGLIIAFDLLLFLASNVNYLKLPIIEQLQPISLNNELKDIKVNIKNPILLWSWKNYNFNKTASSTLSLLLTIVMLFNIIAAASLNYINKAIKSSSPADIEISAYNGAGTDYIGVPENTEFGIRQEDCDFLLDTPIVDDSIVIRFILINIMNPLSTANVNNPEYQYWISDSYKSALKKYGYSDDIYLNQDFLLATDNSSLKRFENNPNLQGEINYEKLNSCEEVILCNAGGLYKDYSVGDTIKLTQIINGKKYDFIVTVGAIINFESGNYFESMESWAFGDHMIWGIGSFEKAGLSPAINKIYISLKNTEEIIALDEKLNEFAEAYSSLETNCQFSIDEHYQQTQQLRNIRKLLNSSYIFIIIMIMFFAVISSIVTLQVRIEQQRKALASMRAIGLKKGQMFQVIFLEKLCQLVFSLILSTILSLILIFLVNKNYGVNFVSFPWLAHCALVLFLIVAMSIVAYIPVSFFYKKTITSQLKEKS